MRLIDADALTKALADLWYDGKITITGVSVADLIANAPTVDAVEVVRCKDCKYSRNAYPMICHLGKALTIIESGDCFCSYAERKDK